MTYSIRGMNSLTTEVYAPTTEVNTMAATNKQQAQQATPCPECGEGSLQTSSHGSCGICFACGYSPCS